MRFNIPLTYLLAASYAYAGSTQSPLTTDESGPVRTAESWGYENCGEPDDLIELTSLQVSPDPPQIGQNLTIIAEGVVKKPIHEGANAHVVVKLGLIKLLTRDYDICTEAENADIDIKCPVTEGSYKIEKTVELPKEIPRGKFSVELDATSVDDEPMLCLKLKIDWLKRPFFQIW